MLTSLVDYLGTKKLAIGMECFYRQHQNALDNFVFDHGSMGKLKEETNWKETWGYDLFNYAKILNYAHVNKIRIVGLNIPLQVVEFVSRNGYDSLPEAFKELIPGLDLSNAKHKRRFYEMIGMFPDEGSAINDGTSSLSSNVHGKLSNKQLENLYEAQTIWDEYMADSASNFLNQNPSQELLLICGVGHAMGRANIPDRITKRTNERPFVIVPYEVSWVDETGLPDIDVPPAIADCDWAWFTEPEITATVKNS